MNFTVSIMAVVGYNKMLHLEGMDGNGSVHQYFDPQWESAQLSMSSMKFCWFLNKIVRPLESIGTCNDLFMVFIVLTI